VNEEVVEVSIRCTLRLAGLVSSFWILLSPGFLIPTETLLADMLFGLPVNAGVPGC